MTPQNPSGPGLSRRRLLNAGALAGAGLAAGPLRAACGGSSGGPGGGGDSVTWASWANPGEAKRFKAYSADYQKRTKTKVKYQVVVGDYQAKLLSQLAGNAAPDAFYVGDAQMAKLASSKRLVDLTKYLDSKKAKVKEDDFFPGLLDWCRPIEGKGLFGLPVDCNPAVFWYNSDILQEAGVSSTPAEMFEAGKWNQDAITDLLSKVKKTGKRGLVLESSWFNWFGWVTAFGGTMFDDSGKAVFDTDPKSQDAITWIFDQLDSKNMVYGGSLPKGQGVDALFYSGRLATIQYGRWLLPNLKELKFTYDIAPHPSLEGKEVMPVPIATAAMAVNANAKNMDKALQFMADFVNAEGQKYRLSDGGNAVPAVDGLEEVVTAGGKPANAKIFLEVAEKGYAIPTAIANDAKIATEFPLLVDRMLKKGNETPKSFSEKLVALLNGEG